MNRIQAETDLEWLFEFASGDLGLSSAHGGFVAMVEQGSQHKGYSDGESATNHAIGRLSDAARFKKISTIVRELSMQTQKTLYHAFTYRKWSMELARRPIRLRAAACDCKLVRDYIEARGKNYTIAEAERLLVVAEKSVGDEELKRLRVRVWDQAEKNVDRAVKAYMDAAVPVKKAAG